MSKHTPGPWEVFEHEGPTGFKGGTQAEFLRDNPDGWASGCTAFGVMGPECHEVAQAHPLYRNGRVRLDEERANANLIAAAPDLLVALREWQACMDSPAVLQGTTHAAHLALCAFTNKVNAAIAKAEVRS